MNITILTFESSLYNTTVRRYVALYVRRVLKCDINIPKIRTRCRIVFSHLQRINWCLCGRARDRVSSAGAIKSAAMSLTLSPTPLNDHVFPSIILQSLVTVHFFVGNTSCFHLYIYICVYHLRNLSIFF